MSDQVDLVISLKESLEKFREKDRMVLSALQELSELNGISYDILKDTGIGKTVNSFRKEGGEVGAAAKNLVTKWKAMTSEALKQKSDQNDPTRTDINKRPSSSVDTQPAKMRKVSKKLEKTLETPVIKSEKPDRGYDRCNMSVRENVESNDICAAAESKSRVKTSKLDKDADDRQSSSTEKKVYKDSVKKAIEAPVIKSEKPDRGYDRNNMSGRENVESNDICAAAESKSRVKTSKLDKNVDDRHSNSTEKKIYKDSVKDSVGIDIKEQQSSKKHLHGESSVDNYTRSEKIRKVSKKLEKTLAAPVVKSEKLDREYGRCNMSVRKKVERNDVCASADSKSGNETSKLDNATVDRQPSNTEKKIHKDSVKDFVRTDVKQQQSNSESSHRDIKSLKSEKSSRKDRNDRYDKHDKVHKSKKNESKGSRHERKSEKKKEERTFEEMLTSAPSLEINKKKKKAESFEEKIAKSVAKVPLPTSFIDDLPELLTEYKPLPKLNHADTSKPSSSVSSMKFEFKDIKASSRSDAVYSGRRRGNTTMHSLKQLCLLVLGNHLDDLGFVGGVPYDILEPVLKKATPSQLYNIEEYNTDFTQDTDSLWHDHCNRDFRGKKPQEFESWRELYLRLFEEREKKFEQLQSKIAAKEQQKLSEVRKSQVAYAMSSQPKPPREVRRQQAKYGTGSGSLESTARAANMMRIDNLTKPSHSAAKTLTVVPPLMKKAKKFMSQIHRR